MSEQFYDLCPERYRQQASDSESKHVQQRALVYEKASKLDDLGGAQQTCNPGGLAYGYSGQVPGEGRPPQQKASGYRQAGSQDTGLVQPGYGYQSQDYGLGQSSVGSSNAPQSAMVPPNFDFEVRDDVPAPPPKSEYAQAMPQIWTRLLRLEDNTKGRDQTLNEARNFHPRPFNDPGDDCKEIRLLKIVILGKGEDSSAQIHCYFMSPRPFATKAFWKRTEYAALSYTWGPARNPDDVVDILIHDVPVSVRKNLHDFLHTMRHVGNEGPFWIDALCIDQSSAEEKTKQLQLMPQIYARASTVLVWLGNYGENAAAGVTNLHQRYARKDSVISVFDPVSNYRALKYIVENKYWTRLWIVQEMILARRIVVYTGARRWRFSDLKCIREALGAINWSYWDSVVEAKNERRIQKLDLHEALFRWSGQDCGVTHDKVYGLLGLVSKPRIKIDLSISMLDLLDEVLRLEKDRIYKEGYKYAIDFTTKLLASLKIENVESAKTMKTEFLKGYRE